MTTTLHRWITTTTTLAVASAGALVLSTLALTDIGHGEADLRLEWWVVRSTVLVFALLVATTLATLAKVKREVGPGTPQNRISNFDIVTEECRHGHSGRTTAGPQNTR